MELLTEFKKQLGIEGRNLSALLLSLGLCQIAGYYLSAAFVNGSGDFSAAQPDTLLYCQAARRIVEGHAFSFSAGSAVCTGTTSVLYPFVLAIPYALGMVGEKLFLAGFVLNALFYLVFLFGWAAAFRQWMKPPIALFSTVLLALFPQTAFCALAQSDTGLWMAVSALFAAGIAKNNPLIYFPALLVGPWVRPEGIILILALAFVSVVRKDVKAISLSCLGVISVVGVFLFNAHLTGAGGFSSVANKGYFTLFPFATAVTMACGDLITLIRELVLCQSMSGPRYCYSIPVVGSLAAVVGFLVWDWRQKHVWAWLVLCLAAVGGLMIVAQSGWQGSNCDRYLAWIMPLFIALGAVGWYWTYGKFSKSDLSWIILSVPLVFSAGSAVYLMCIYHNGCANTDQFVKFGTAIEEALPRKSSLGTLGWSGLAYQLGERRLAHLFGIYSPEFAMKDNVAVSEVLKNEPDTRFDYLLISPDDNLPEGLRKMSDSSVLVGPAGYEVRKADWCNFDRAAVVPACEGACLVDRIDVGYEKDEKKSNYETVQRYGMRSFELIASVHKGPDGEMADVGRLVAGYDEMDVTNLTPGRDLLIKMRTANETFAANLGDTGVRSVSKYSFSGRIGMHVTVDGACAACEHLSIATNGFSDVTMRIPAKSINARTHRIGFMGDHLSYAYWFYQ